MIFETDSQSTSRPRMESEGRGRSGLYVTQCHSSSVSAGVGSQTPQLMKTCFPQEGGICEDFDLVDVQQKGSRHEQNYVSLIIIQTYAAVSKEGQKKMKEELWKYFLLIRPREFKTMATEQIHERIPEEEIG